jgi:endonuclease/exonuclease/phosphatase family metal-dependent hydrolase
MTKQSPKSLVVIALLCCAAIGATIWALVYARAHRKPHPGIAVSAHPGRAIRVMTANIKLADPKDGRNRWSRRRRLLATVFNKYRPAIIGMQESTPVQTAWLSLHLHGYVHYPDNAGTSSMLRMLHSMAHALAVWNEIFFKADRFRLVLGRHGPLRPHHPQPDPTENAYYALAVLRDRAKILPDIIMIDTHLRHGVPNARLCALKLQRILHRWERKYPRALAVVTGDMNHDRLQRPVYRALSGYPWARKNARFRMQDTFDYALKPPGALWGTWQNFTGKPSRVWPSDLIFVSAGWRYRPAVIARDHSASGRYPTDHFLVYTDITPRRKSSSPAILSLGPRQRSARQ